MRLGKWIAVVLLAVLCCSALASAFSVQSPRSDYTEAYARLLQARALMEQENRSALRDEKKRALQEMDAAIEEMKQMLHAGGRTPQLAPPQVDKKQPDAILRTSLALLNEAVEQIFRSRTPEQARNAQGRLLSHMNEARKSIHHALQSARR